tara:strand:+ start:12935 stop:13312 length:378 start_codon:yes stop_codon:yes gene_type:complete
MNKIKSLIISLFLVISLSACRDQDKYNIVSHVVSNDDFYQVCLSNVTYYLKATRIDAHKGYMTPKLTTDTKIIPCNPTEEDRVLEAELFNLCLDNVVYYLRSTRIDGYKGYMSPKFNTDSKVVTC